MIKETSFPPIILFLLFTAGAAWLHPRREEMLRLGRLGNPELLALVALVAVPLTIYVADQLCLQRGAAAGDSHMGAFQGAASVKICSGIGYPVWAVRFGRWLLLKPYREFQEGRADG
jgi:hypothetical protein